MKKIVSQHKILLIVAALATSIVSAVYLGYQSYLADFNSSLLAELPISVFIENPQPGSMFEQGSAVMFHAKSSGPSSVAQIEFYVDGELVEIQAAPIPEGLVLFQAFFTWHADDLGPHVFFARALTAVGGTETSASLPIIVVEEGTLSPEEADQAYLDTGPHIQSAMLTQTGGAPYFGQPADHGEPPNFPISLTPAQPYDGASQLPKNHAGGYGISNLWSPSIFDWFNSLLNQLSRPPEKPLLFVDRFESAECLIMFDIVDQSDNEDYFALWQKRPGFNSYELRWSAQGGDYDPGFSVGLPLDSNDFGTHFFFIETVNTSGRVASNIVMQEMGPNDCTQQNQQTTIFLDLKDLLGANGSTRSYCYFSTDDENWFRHPAFPQTFMDTSQGGSEDPQSKLPLGELAASSPITLDCWGWEGDDLTEIGSWHFDNVSDSPDLPKLSPPGLSLPDTVGLSGNFVDLLVPYDPSVPIPNLTWGKGQSVCADHVGNNPFFILVCADIADDLDYAVWSLGQCPAKPCSSQSEVVGYNVYDSRYLEGKAPVKTVKLPISLYFLFDETSCKSRYVQVTALVEKNGQVVESFPSNQIYYPGNPHCVFAEVTLRVTLDTIDFSVAEINDQDDNVDAIFYAFAEVFSEDVGKGYYWNISGTVLGSPIDKFDSLFYDEINVNPYYWKDIVEVECSPSGYLGCFLNPTTHIGEDAHGWGDINIYKDQWAALHIEIYDYDPPLEFDKACVPGDFYFTTTDIEDAPNQILYATLSASHETASCEVNFHVQIVD